jgi:hydrogenase-4 membrane subunit HyfE
MNNTSFGGTGVSPVLPGSAPGHANHEYSSAARGWFKVLIALMWLALPVIVFRYWQVWGQLPARMVTHFGPGGRPNGWMSPSGSLTFSLILVTIMLAVFTGVLLYALRRMRQLDSSAWALLGLFYVIVSVITLVCDSILRYNLSQTPVPVGMIGFAICAAVFVFVVVFLHARRGSVLAAANVFCEETHGSRLFAAVFLLPAIPMILSAAIVPIPAVKLALTAGILVMAGCATMAWDGFHYLFSSAGVDIRTLGFRLRSIHAADIQTYAADRWNVLGGYGVRGLGDRRAYVWGNSGVRIKTREGEVFLGHSDPERIVRYLDVITNHKGHEGTQSI